MTIYLRLSEDSSYSTDDLVRQLVLRANIGEDRAKRLISSVLQKIRNSVEPLVAELARFYSRRFRFNVKPISIQGKVLEVGEWVGVYKIHAKEEEVILIIEPKIEEKAFEEMVNHIIEYLPPGINVEALLHRYIHDSPNPFLSFHDILAYSSLFISLLEVAFREGLPLTIIGEEGLDMNVYGSINVEKSIASCQIFEDKVFSTKNVTIYSKAFLTIISLCNELLYKHLENIINNPLPLGYVKDKVMRRLKLHRYIAGSPIFSGVPAPMNLTELDECIKKAYVECGKKLYSKRLLDLIVQFLGKHRVFEAKLRPWTEIASVFILIPSALVYELWILSLMVRLLRERNPSIIISKDSFIEIHSVRENLKIDYQGSPMTFLRPYYPRIAYRPRPDFVLTNSLKGKLIVCDAKYRKLDNLRSEDYERIMSYIVTISKGDEQAGFLLLLNSGLKPGINLIRERTDVKPPIRLYAVELDPRRPKQALDNLNRLFNHIKQ